MNSLISPQGWKSCLIYLTFILVLGQPLPSVSQCVTPENSYSFCEGADLLCLQQYCSSTPEFPITNCCYGWCGNNTSVSNPLYYQFLPIESEVEIEIHVDFCSSGAGLQCAIIDACPWDNSNILDCNPGVSPGGTMNLHPSGLVVGQVYWLMIDGSNSAVCNFTITSASGIFDDFDLPELELDETSLSDTIVCPGYNYLFVSTGPSFPGAHYQWSFDGTIMYDTGLPYTYFNLSPFIPDGEYLVCVQAITDCDSTNQICKPITIQSPPIEILDTTYFCSEEFPFFWNENLISGPGDYTFSIPQPDGCSIDCFWPVRQYPLSVPGHLDTMVCNQLNINGQIFDQPGHFSLLFPNATIYGCDSILELDLIVDTLEQFVELVCENEEQVLQAHIISQGGSDTVTFEWYPCSFDSLLSSATAFIPDTAGCFSLVTQSGGCVDTISSNYIISPCEFTDSCELLIKYACINDTVLITPEFTLDSGVTIHWLIDFPGDTNSYSGNTDSIYVSFSQPGIYPVSFTIQDSFQSRTCHTEIEIQAGIDVSICCDGASCDSCFSFSIFNHSGIIGAFAINNGPPYAISGNSEVHETICFPASELDTTIIQITEVESDNGCASRITGDSFITFIPLPQPLVFIVPLADTLCSYPNDLAEYRWRYCDSTIILSTSTCFVPMTSGCYCLEVENEFGCTYETCSDFVLSDISTVLADQIRISPNPSNGNITVELPSAELPVDWRLSDLEGKFILSGTLINTKSDLRLKALSAGIYFLKFDFGKNGILLKKIVIE